jgi:tRNA-2-methylthio-N6-dimethylallyladenosine synthase
VSYSLPDIVAAVTKDVAMGSREVTLIGQNVNSYRDPGSGARFPELLDHVARVSGQFWTRFMSPHPQDMTHDLFDVMSMHRPKITAALHFPLQSGSDRILQLMNRNYTVEQYKEKIEWIRTKLPGATISTDIIVGFPGETQQEFDQTMQLVEQVRFDLIYSFIYSPRRYTKASSLEDHCSLVEKTRRLDKLQKRQVEIAAELNAANIGRNLQVLVEKRLSRGKLLSRTEGNIRVLLDGSDDLVGQFVTVHIEQSGPTNMTAVVIP